MAATWAVVATVDEPAALLAAFAAHHLDLGAAAVHLFLDAPNPEAEALLAGIPRLRVTLCDDEWWRTSRRGSRPQRHTARQKSNAAHVYRQGEVDWLLHCDADEFVWPLADLAAELALAGDRFGYLNLRVAERAWTGEEGDIFVGRFRTPLPDFAARGAAIYGPRVEYLKDGLSGHSTGKGIVKTGREYEMGVHHPVPGAVPVPMRPANAARLLHFDGLTPLHFALKLLKRATESYGGPPRPHGAHRILQFTRMAAAARDAGAWRALAAEVQGLTAAQAEALEAADGLLEARPDIAGALARQVPGRAVDLSREAFDAALRQREAALIAATGLAL